MSSNCPLCGAADFTTFGLYRQCSACQAFYLVCSPNRQRINTVIDQEAKRMLATKQNPNIFSVHRKRLADLKQAGLPRGSILDVGCGRGLFLQVARENGFQAVGLDKSRHLAAAIKRQGFPAVISFSRLKGKRFQAVVAFDVIEHTLAPKQLLNQMLNHLKPRGLLMLTTPNAAGISAKILKHHWWVLDPKRHYVLFSPQALKRCLAQLGLEVIALSSDTLTPWVMPSGTFQARVLNKLVYLLLAPLRSLLFARSLGDNLQIIARKPYLSAKKP